MNPHWQTYLDQYVARAGHPPRFLTETMGCQMNERDSETVAGLLAGMGYAPAASRDDADVIVVNTCSVRENADHRFFGRLGQIKKFKERRPALITAVCGCMMQQAHIVNTIQEKYSWVNLIFGTHNIHRLPDLLSDVAVERARAAEVWADGGEIVEGLPAMRTCRFKAFVNVAYGCDNYCSYCVVPYTRGRERSRRPADVLREIRELAADGVKEIMLLGQNVNSYAGRDDPDADATCDFPALIERIDAVSGIERLRFMTSHPKDVSDRLIAAFGAREKLCNAIHLPVQSGSSRVLARMNRGYTKADYMALIERIRAVSPDIAVTTDFITGFPGETEADFEETMDLIERVRFDAAFTFIYSIRKGTPAADYPDQVPEADKHRRFNRLVERLNAITAEKNAARLGRIERVLVEGPDKSGRDDGIMTGRTDAGKVVNFPAPADTAGRTLSVRVTGVRTFSLYGELADAERAR